MSTKHTPGPWFMTGRMTRYVEAKIDGGLIQEVAAVGPTLTDGGYDEQQQANAQLIAAAPDLLAALQLARRELHACQAVIHLAGGFDPAYVSGAQAALKVVDEAISRAAGGEV